MPCHTAGLTASNEEDWTYDGNQAVAMQMALVPVYNDKGGVLLVRILLDSGQYIVHK